MPHCADSRGGGMTDTPTGLSRQPDTGHGARTQHHPPRHSEPPTFLLPLPACAGRRRRPGPAAAARSALRADPGHRRLSRRAHRHAEEDQKHQRTRLTDPAPFRDDLRKQTLHRSRRCSCTQFGPVQVGSGYTAAPVLLHPDQSKRSCREHLTSRQMLVENGQIAHPVDSEPDSAVPPGVPTPRLDLVLEPVTMGALDWRWRWPSDTDPGDPPDERGEQILYFGSVDGKRAGRG